MALAENVLTIFHVSHIVQLLVETLANLPRVVTFPPNKILTDVPCLHLVYDGMHYILVGLKVRAFDP